MRKFVKYVTVVGMGILVLSSCIKEDNCEDSINNEKELVVQPVLSDIATRASAQDMKTSFTDGNKLGVMVLDENALQGYRQTNDFTKMYSIYIGGKWSNSEVVNLNDDFARIFAYYPYEDGRNTEQVLLKENSYWYQISSDTQTDYLCGAPAGESNRFNRYNYTASLRMKHVMSMFSFKFKKMKYEKEGKLESITFNNLKHASGNTFCYLQKEAEIDLITGLLKKEYKPVETPIRETISTVTISDEYPQEGYHVFCIPSMEALPDGESVEIAFVIDGKRYQFNLPATTVWEAGTIYTYSVILDGTEPDLVIESVTIEDWQNQDRGEVTVN